MTPFLDIAATKHLKLEPVVTDDPILQRISGVLDGSVSPTTPLARHSVPLTGIPRGEA